MNKGVYFFVSIIIFLCSCKTYNKNITQEPYNGLTILYYENNTAYEFRNEKTDKLIIYIDGTGWYSVLGWKSNNQWGSVGFSNFITRLFQDTYNILIPERLNMQIEKYYHYNPEMRKKYTLENLVESYSETINIYLSENNYKSIILTGYSEGACLLPLIYEKLDKKNNITGIVSISYGGLSVYEQIKILGNSEVDMPEYYREACMNIDELKKEVELYPNSIGEVMGYTYKWWNSFMNYRPYDNYKNMNIPILFIHGSLDITVPVESTKYIEDNLPGKPYEYKYIDDADHNFRTQKSKEIFEKYFVEWVKAKI